MILPLSAELGLGKLPYVTAGIIILCLVIHYFQDENRRAINTAARSYCASIHNPYAAEDSLDYLIVDEENCRRDLPVLYSLPDISVIREFISDDEVPPANMDDFIARLDARIQAFRQMAPASLDNRLSYDPSSFNPITSLASALAHGGWSHVIGNLIFFFAFAPAVELLVGGALRYLGVLILIELSCDLTYSLVSLGSYPIPTLGLSGVVMGIIGLSAYLMPWARIRTLVWYLFFIRTYSIPAWILALWFAGWDAYDLFTRTDNGGVNVVAHVSAAVAGYLIGVLLFKKRREETREELADEIDYRRSLRDDRLGMMSSYRGGKRLIADEQRERQAKEQFNLFMDELYQQVSSRRDSDAIVLLLDKYALYSPSPEIYEETFWTMHKWRQGRALLCLGRLNINELLQHRQYARALAIAEACVAITDEFTLATPCEVIQLTEHARMHRKFDLAYRLVHEAERRYGEAVNVAQCQLLEADLLEHHLNNPSAAKVLMDMVLEKKDPEVTI